MGPRTADEDGSEDVRGDHVGGETFGRREGNDVVQPRAAGKVTPEEAEGKSVALGVLVGVLHGVGVDVEAPYGTESLKYRRDGKDAAAAADVQERAVGILGGKPIDEVKARARGGVLPRAERHAGVEY